MPGPFVVPFHGDIDLPSEVDVVVVGGGIVGVSTALELVVSGMRVALCEKGGIGQEQSSRNWGWVRIARRDPREVPLMAEGLRIWQGLDARIGRDTGYSRSGIVFACATDEEYAQNEKWNGNLNGSSLESRMISALEFEELFPGSKLAVKGALFTAADGRAEPQKVAPAIAEFARERGAYVMTECAVRGYETAAGKICGVVTERGAIKCQAVVLAGGAWSNLFLGNYGIDLPQLKVMNSVLRTKPMQGGPDQALWSKGFALRRRQDGGYTVSSGHENTVQIVPDTFRYARKFLPALKSEWRSLNLRLGISFLDDARLPRHWSLDEPGPFEYNRVLDPKPEKQLSNDALMNVRKAFPAFAKAEGRDSGSDVRMIWEEDIENGTKVSVWKAEPGLYIYPARDLDETFVIIEGTGLCSLDHSAPVKISTGSIVRIPKGVAITLDVKSPLRQVATIVPKP